MRIKEVTRRDFLKGAGWIGLGSSFFFLILPNESRCWVGSRTQRSLASLGTRINITIFDVAEGLAESAIRRAFREIEAIHFLMSTHEPESDLSLVNRYSGSEFIKVDARVIEVVGHSQRYSRQSGGVFDATILPLLKAWGFRNHRFDHSPDERRILSALEKVGYEQVVLNETGVGLKRRGAGLDLGGIAKGYAVDRVAASLSQSGVRQFIVEAGGDLFAAGRPPDRDAWSIGIKHPLRPEVCAILDLKDHAVATSGNTDSYVNYGGRHYGHLINPRTGKPVETYLSISAVAPTALEADAASTTLFVAGRGAGGNLVGSTSAWLQISQDTLGRLVFVASPNFPSWVEV